MKMQYATRSRLGRSGANLLHIYQGQYQHYQLRDLPKLMDSNSLLVVNDAATLPASLHGYIGSLQVELRLVSNNRKSQSDIRSWIALLFYKGSWRQPTEDRLNPDFVEPGDIIKIGDLRARIDTILHPSKRLINITFEGEISSIWSNLYRYGRPIQYSHLDEDLELWDIQTIFSSIPVAVEPPSASFQFTWDLLSKLGQKGVEITSITHGTSISSTGIEDIDELLPFPEYYWIDPQVAIQINIARQENRPIIALGTSVTRALEHNYSQFEDIKDGSYQATNIITANTKRNVVSGLITGMHLPEETHLNLLLSFINSDLLFHSYESATLRNYLWHEYGDLSFIQLEE